MEGASPVGPGIGIQHWIPVTQRVGAGRRAANNIISGRPDTVLPARRPRILYGLEGSRVSGTKEILHVEVDRGRALVSRSLELHRIWSAVQRVAPADGPVLITGETGTGKESVGRLIHKLSPRAAKEFVSLDCDAVAPSSLESELFGHERGAFTGADRRRVGVFELAHGATLFLDEIENLPLETQAKLLRVLQDGKFRRLGDHQPIRSGFRLVIAASTDLGAAVRAGAFHEDLLHRLQVVHIHLPPLRERREDIPLLVSYFVDQKRLRRRRPRVQRVSHQAVDLLMSHDWPGNVRELENVIETAVVACSGDTIEPAHLVFGGAGAAPGPSAAELDLPFRTARQRTLATFETLYLLAQLRRYRGRTVLVAQHAGITPKHVRALMKRHGIRRRDFRPPVRPRPISASERQDGQDLHA